VVAQAAATLPSQVVADAQVRGAASDLWQAARELVADYGQINEKLRDQAIGQ
jgi:hypothetical protein